MQQSDRQFRTEWVEPEVIPPRRGRVRSGRPLFGRLNAAFGPIAAGIVIDTLDIATFGRFGILAGLLIGGTAAFWMTSVNRLPVWQRVLISLLAGFYCTMPRTEWLPLATLVGALSRFMVNK